MTNAEIFIDKYKQLEEVVRITYKLKDSDSISYYLSSKSEYKRFQDEIKYCQDVRNLLNHKKKIKDTFAVEPNQQMIDFIDNLIEKIKKRLKCSDIWIPYTTVYWQPMSVNVKDAMLTMKKNMFTHTPILEGKRVIGVFDENSIFTYLTTEEIIEVDDVLTFEDIKDHISLFDREMETFVFVKATTYVEELEKKIQEEFQKNKRVGMAFVTDNGRKDGVLQGIITPWDIIAHQGI